MDHMTPNERAAIVDAGVQHSIDELPEPFRLWFSHTTDYSQSYD